MFDLIETQVKAGEVGKLVETTDVRYQIVIEIEIYQGAA